MLLRIFKTSQPLSWIFILLLLIISRSLLFFLYYSENYIPENILLSYQFTQYLSQNIPVLSHILSLFIIIPTGFLFNKIAQDVNLFKGIHYLLFFFFSIFTSFNPQNLVLSPILLSLPLLLFSLGMILTQSKGQISLPHVFNASFLIGLATIMYPPNIIVFAILIISIFYINTPTWRSILTSVIGVVSPIFFHDSLLYVFNWEGLNFSQSFQEFFTSFSIRSMGTTYELATLFLLILLQIPTYFIATSKSIIKIRKALFLMLYYLLIGIILSGFSDRVIHLVIIPVSILFTSFQLEIRKWWLGDLIFLGLVAALCMNYMQL
ncbi:MAG: DUF6427 family protein [Salibacteraceae bacterium]